MTPTAPEQPLTAGRAAPAFVLSDQHGRDISLAGLRGDVVCLVFFPWVFTPICSAELRDWAKGLGSVGDGAHLLAVSTDPVASLAAFAAQEGISFPILSDFWPHGAVSASYGVLDLDRGTAKRSSFVIDRDGTVRWAVHAGIGEQRDQAEHVRKITEILRS